MIITKESDKGKVTFSQLSTSLKIAVCTAYGTLILYGLYFIIGFIQGLMATGA
jgi:hypothetical protein